MGAPRRRVRDRWTYEAVAREPVGLIAMGSDSKHARIVTFVDSPPSDGTVTITASTDEAQAQSVLDLVEVHRKREKKTRRPDEMRMNLLRLSWMGQDLPVVFKSLFIFQLPLGQPSLPVTTPFG